MKSVLDFLKPGSKEKAPKFLVTNTGPNRKQRRAMEKREEQKEKEAKKLERIKAKRRQL